MKGNIMGEDTKELLRLLLECADCLRLHDEEYRHRTPEPLKGKLRAVLTKHGLETAGKAADKLGMPL